MSSFSKAINLLLAFGIWMADDSNKPMIDVMDGNNNEILRYEVDVLGPAPPNF
jgi:hypothetical protein